MPKLHLLLDGQDIPHDLQGEETVLGRLPECQLQINSGMVSRKHARVRKTGEKYFLEDLGSGNGTFLNGKKLDAPAEIRHDDRIKLGPILLRFEFPESAKRRPAVDDEDEDEKSSPPITGRTESIGGFGRLEVQPQAKLKAVLEISRSLAGTTDLDALLPKILDTLFKVFPHADRGIILFKNEEGKMIPKATKHRRATDDDTVKVSRTILRTVLEQKTGVLSADATSDARFEASESISNLTIRSMMCVPMLNLDGEPIGVISIDTQNPFNQFKEDDLDLLVAVAGQAAMSYESARLLVTAVEKQKQDREMGIAMDVQRALLPTEMPKPHPWEFFASYDTAQAVGGDYFDCMLMPDGKKVCFAFGDVAGKGVPASLVMSKISTVVTITMNFLTDVQEAACRINDQMCTKAVEGRFVTFIIGIIDPETGDLEFVNAGHMPLMIRKVDGTIVEIGEEAVGVPLGVMEGFPYDVVKCKLEPGETIVLYTDGVSEAMNPNSDLYGMERLRALVHTSNAGKAEELGKTILADVRKFANGRPQNDDITIMVIGRGT
ncbi:MAG TPA: SpoIIE family protein phosphatase [Planctomycetaceae bacterium]|nr:SpoIIE family protein phosphatase [Planctomycetaceae bacterium]